MVVIRSGLLLSPVPEEILSGCIYRSWFFLRISKSSGGRRLALGVAADAGGRVMTGVIGEQLHSEHPALLPRTLPAGREAPA